MPGIAPKPNVMSYIQTLRRAQNPGLRCLGGRLLVVDLSAAMMVHKIAAHRDDDDQQS